MHFTGLTDIPVIDAHVHAFPLPVFKAMWAWFDQYAWDCHYKIPAEELVELLRDHGAAGQVYLVYAHRPGVAESFNEMLAALVGGSSDLRGLAAVHPQDEDPAGIVHRALDRPNIVGIKLHHHVMGLPIDDPMFEPILGACVERGALLNAHAGTEPSSDSGVNGYGLDVRTVSGVERVRRVLERHPDLRLIIPHLGIGQVEEFCELLAEYPNLMLDSTMVLCDQFALDIDPEILNRHAGRIMFGTDTPNIPHEFTHELEKLLNMGLPRKKLEAILSGNAKRVFGF